MKKKIRSNVPKGIVDKHDKELNMINRKVIYTGKGGYDHDKETGNKYLVVGQEYTIENEVIQDWTTDTYLEEIQDKWPTGVRVYFNSVMFREINQQESSSEFIERTHPNMEQLKEWENAQKDTNEILYRDAEEKQ